MDFDDLKAIFRLCAWLTLAVGVVGLAVDVTWGFQYLVVALLAGMNYGAIALVAQGLLHNRFVPLFYGISLKLFLLVLLLVVAVRVGIELTSFLAAANTFFVSVFLYIAGRWAGRSLRASAAGRLPEVTHG